MIQARLLALILLSASLGAGCLGGSTPTPATKETATLSPAAAPLANATPNETAPVAPPPVPISYSGTSPTGACSYGTPADQCQFSQTGSESFHVVDAKGVPRRVVVKIEYGAQQPGMTFYASVCTGKKGDAASFQCNDYKSAPSPMTLDVDLKALPADGAIALSVGSLAITPTPSGALVFSSVDFKVQGTLTLAPASA